MLNEAFYCLLGLYVCYYAWQATKPNKAKQTNRKPKARPNKVKPPQGVTPRFIKDIERHQEIQQAMERYHKAGLDVPHDWVSEYNFLGKQITEQNRRQSYKA